MDTKIDFRSLMGDSRARVYLLWAILTGIGYVATHYYQERAINILWVVLSVIGLGFMYRVMPLGVSQMKRIYLSWLVPIAFGVIVSGLVFYIDGIAQLLGYLGAFWLLVQAVGFFWNGLVDPPSNWYYIAAAVNVIAAIACYAVDILLPVQYFSCSDRNRLVYAYAMDIPDYLVHSLSEPISYLLSVTAQLGGTRYQFRSSAYPRYASSRELSPGTHQVELHYREGI